MTSTLLKTCGAALALALLLSACGTVRTARMALPQGLADRTDVVALPQLGSGRRGNADVMGQALQYERASSRLALFEDFSVAQRSALRYSLADGSHDPSAAHCAARRRNLSAGIVDVTAKPLTLWCEFTPTGAHLNLDEHRPGLGAHKVERRGQLTLGGRTLTVHSVHRPAGSLFELAQPMGYVIEEGGRPVAAVEINGPSPRLFLPVGDTPLRQASLHALLALALIWDVANG